MTNHYHLVVGTPDGRLSRAMKALNGTYARQFDVRHSRTAHVFQNRFRSELVDTDEYLLTVSRYVALNPVRAGLCGHPAEWPWSSYRALAGIDAAPDFLSETFILSLFGDVTETARAGYRRFVNDELDSNRCLTPEARTPAAPPAARGRDSRRLGAYNASSSELDDLVSVSKAALRIRHSIG